MTTDTRQGEPPGERLLQSLFKMTGAINLYNANNQRMFSTIDAFREAIEEIRAQAGLVTLRVHHGRFYLNRQLLALPPAMVALGTKLADYFEARGVRGFRFIEAERLWDEQVIGFVDALNRAEREKDPAGWLKTQLEGGDYAWVEPLGDEDYTLDGVAEGAEDSGGGERQALAVSAREAYSQALTAIMSTLGKLPSQKPVSVQQTKRVIQNMIDILTEDESVLLGLGTIRDYDDYTYTHSVNVAILAMCLGRRLGLSRTLIEQVGLCGLFHDLGKVDVPVELITKRGRLTAAEYEQVKKHPVYSIRQIMRFTADYDMKAKFILPPFEHHLGVDLSGYPQTDRREPLSLVSRVISIADYYDALTSCRSYRPTPFSPDAALRIMVGASGTKLDAVLLKVFIDMIGVYPTGSLLLFDTGEFGLVAEVPETSTTGRPVVVLLRRDGDAFVKGGSADLSERDENGEFKRNVARSFHPSEYGIQPADFLG